MQPGWLSLQGTAAKQIESPAVHASWTGNPCPTEEKESKMTADFPRGIEFPPGFGCQVPPGNAILHLVIGPGDEPWPDCRYPLGSG